MLEAFLLGIIQGLTEFLPVSSSGHIELFKIITGKDFGNANVFFTVLLHAATALSTIIVFRKDIAEIIAGLFQKENKEAKAFSIKVILSMIPAAIVGLLFEEELDAMFTGNALLVGCMLLFTAVLLFVSEKIKNTNEEITFSKSIIIGVAQAVAILPGISRSGATIATALLLKIDKSKAARFSFLMVVPLILGKMAKDSLDIIKGNEVINLPISEGVIGFLAAFFAGIAACTWMIKIVRKSKLSWFALYCAIVGLIAVSTHVFA
jgi:undecaprenyl-diphosphatase